MIHVSAERRVVSLGHGEFDRRDYCWRGHVAKRVRGKPRDVDHKGDPTARPDVHFRAAAGDSRQSVAHRTRQFHGIFGDPGAQRAASATHEHHRAHRRLAVFCDPRDRFLQRGGHGKFDRT